MRRLARALARPSVRAASRARAQASMASDAAPVIPSGVVEHPGWDYFRNVLGSAAYHVAPMVRRAAECFELCCMACLRFLPVLQVDQSELAFRELCRRYGATCAYTPMLHARCVVKGSEGAGGRRGFLSGALVLRPDRAFPDSLFVESEAYRAEHFTTCAVRGQPASFRKLPSPALLASAVRPPPAGPVLRQRPPAAPRRRAAGRTPLRRHRP